MTTAQTKSNDPNKDLHPQVIDKDILKNSGKDVGLVDPPIKSVAPVSSSQTIGDNKNQKKDIKKFSDVSKLIGDDGQEEYPFEDLELGEAFFIPTQPNNTTDNLLAKLHKSINSAKQKYGEVEVNEEGDEIWEVLTIMTKKRNEDGTIQLENNKPITGADFHQRPKYIYTRNFVAKAVTKDQEFSDSDKAPADGVVVIRVA